MVQGSQFVFSFCNIFKRNFFITFNLRRSLWDIILFTLLCSYVELGWGRTSGDRPSLGLVSWSGPPWDPLKLGKTFENVTQKCNKTHKLGTLLKFCKKIPPPPWLRPNLMYGWIYLRVAGLFYAFVFSDW